MKVIVTGGAGFIGANFLNLSVPKFKSHHFVNVDSLTYAANPLSLKGTDKAENYSFRRVDIADDKAVEALFEQEQPDLVVHFAAESHVDRSIHGPAAFVRTNIQGTFNLLDACRKRWGKSENKLFHHVSTDEVYGTLGDEGMFTEKTPYDPSSPYSASKAASDHLVRAFHRTYGMPVKLTNCSNNYGPLQFPEKLIPLMIQNAVAGKALPVYGEGLNVRDWLYVEDHCTAIWSVIEKGVVGETYNVGGNNEVRNIDVVHRLCSSVATQLGKSEEELLGLITHVKDRPGHDYRYAIDSSKLQRECGWEPKETFETGLAKTVDWYLTNDAWMQSIQSGDYRKWMEKNYQTRT